MRLLSFDPKEVLSFKVNDETRTGRELFDAFWIIYKTGDQPNAENVRVSIKLRDMLEARTVPGGSIKLSICSACGQRVARYDELRTFTGDDPLHLRLEEQQFKYLQECVGKWVMVSDELRRYFGYLQDAMDATKALSADEIDVRLLKGA